MLALYSLCVFLSNYMFFSVQMALVSSPVIGIESSYSKGLQQLFQAKKDIILASSQYISQHDSSRSVDRMPKPSLIGFTANVAPHLIHLRSLLRLLNFMGSLGFYDVHFNVIKRSCFQESKIYRLQFRLFFLAR